MGEPTATHGAVREILGKLATASGAQTAESLGPLRGSVAGRTLRPRRYGGLAKEADEFISEICDLAALDGSLGWLAAMFNSAAYELARLPEQAADAVWRSDPDALIVSSYQGEGQLSTGRLTGRWDSVIGAEYADWLLLTADNGAAWRVLVPRSVARIEPVSDHTGLGAAGVCDVTVSGVTVDDEHAFERDHDRVRVVAAAAAAAAVVGSADGVWRQHVRQARARLATSYGGDEATSAACVQVARAASDIDAAKLQVMTSLLRTDDVVAGKWAYRQAVARAREAADRLLGNSRHALDASDRVTRLWRDVHAGYRMALRVLDGS